MHFVAPLLFAMLLVGCQAQYVDYGAYIDQPGADEAVADYRIESPDVLTVRSRIVREIDGRRITVQPDGTIALPLLGRIQAGGKTRAELSAIIRERADAYYIRPEVEVRIARYASRHVYVYGAVARPGAQPYNARNTALSSLAAARPTANGDPTRITVLTPTADGRYKQRAALNLDHFVGQTDRARDIVLKPGEIVRVPGAGPAPPAPTANQVAQYTAQRDAQQSQQTRSR